MASGSWREADTIIVRAGVHSRFDDELCSALATVVKGDSHGRGQAQAKRLVDQTYRKVLECGVRKRDSTCAV